MAKSRFYVLDKQDRVLNSFSKISENEKRNPQPSATEMYISKSKYNSAGNKNSERISLYNPNNPLNGSKSWTKTEQDYFKATGKNPRA